MDVQALESCRQRLSSRTPLLGALLRWLALRTLARDGSDEAVNLLAQTAGKAEVPVVKQQAFRTLVAMAASGNQLAQQSLCHLVISLDHREAEAVVLKAGYIPKALHDRALLFFLTEQWQQYENLDFDQSLLRAAYESGNAALRIRLADKARRAGRVEWAQIVAGGRQLRNLAELTEAEWEAVLHVLANGGRWAELWKLAQNAPVAWGVRVLRRLAASNWRPLEEDQRIEFEKLLDLAARCQGEAPGQWAGMKSSSNEFSLDCACLAISPDGLMATGTGATGEEQNAIQLWDLRQGERVQTLSGHHKRVTCLAVSPNGRTLASGAWDRTVRLWNLPDGTPGPVLHGHSDWVNCLAVSPGGRLLASGSWDATVRLWRLPTGEELRSLEGHGRWLNCLAISASGLLASAGEESQIYLWDLRNLSLVGLLDGHEGPVRCLAITPDGRQLVSAGDDGTVRLWSLRSSREVKSISAHKGGVRALALSQDGRLLATGGDDKVVRLWSLPDGNPLQQLTGHRKAVSGMAISPQGRLLASAGLDQLVKLWPSPVAHLSHMPIQQTSLQDFNWAQQTLDARELGTDERPWLELTLELMHWRRRFEIEIEAAPQRVNIGEFDIEIESA